MMVQTEPQNIRVLIVEDDPDTRELIATILDGAGYNTLSAADGEEGLDKARAERPDLILLDLMIPRVDGIEVCRRLSADDDTRSIPVVIVTAKHELSTKLSSFVAGARRFITKPFESQDLINEIERTLRSRVQPDLSGPTHLDPRD
jgi:DNA-binding response OmpR family regulator